jgi:hypothetical protein
MYRATRINPSVIARKYFPISTIVFFMSMQLHTYQRLYRYIKLNEFTLNGASVVSILKVRTNALRG